MIRTVIVIIGSKTDAPQCVKGLRYLKEETLKTSVIVAEVCAMSAKRNIKLVLEVLKQTSAQRNANVIIAAAGPAAHLHQDLDAFLGYELHDQSLTVIGVLLGKRQVFATEQFIAEASDTRVIYHDDSGPFVGSNGFLHACQYAVSGDFPKLKAIESPSPMFWTLDQALAAAEVTVKK